MRRKNKLRRRASLNSPRAAQVVSFAKRSELELFYFQAKKTLK